VAGYLGDGCRSLHVQGRTFTLKRPRKIDTEALRWLWRHWGTTWALRRVETVTDQPERFAVHFFSADWNPWPALLALQARWPDLALKIEVAYA